MGFFTRLFCRHETVEVKRAHRASEYARKNCHRLGWIDRLEVCNYIVCAHCGKAMRFKSGEHFTGPAQRLP